MAAATAAAVVWSVRSDDAGGRVAFTFGAGPNADEWRIAVVNGDGSGDFELLPFPKDDVVFPAWSPDGKQISYAGSDGLWAMAKDGSNRRRLETWPDAFYVTAAWSPDGKWIAYDSMGVTIVSVDGTKQRRVVREDGREPAWSPDGRSLVYVETGAGDTGEAQLFVVQVAGSEPRQVTHSVAHGAARYPRWSPDGRHIVFTRSRSAETPEYVHIVDADGRDEQQLTWGSDPTWSPDGFRIAFERQEREATVDGGESSIWTMKIDGSDQRKIWPPAGVCDCGQPAWARG